MVEIVIAVLRLPDTRVVLQRRDKRAQVSPGKLGFFGGHVESMETPDQAIMRELSEETSLDVPSLAFKYKEQFQLESDAGEGKVNFNVYEVDIPKADFIVHEGQGAVACTIEEALAQSDLTSSVRHVLNEIVSYNKD